MFDFMSIDYIEWIKNSLKETGKTRIGLAKHLGVSHPQISRMLQGERRIKADELPKIAEYLGRPVPSDKPEPLSPELAPSPFALTAVPIRGEVAAGIWKEIDEFSQVQWEENGQHTVEYATTVLLPGYPTEQQFALIVRGNSLNKIAPDGATLHCLEFINGDAWHVKDGDLVVVQRSKYQGAMIETTAKRVKLNGDNYELWPEKL